MFWSRIPGAPTAWRLGGVACTLAVVLKRRDWRGDRKWEVLIEADADWEQRTGHFRTRAQAVRQVELTLGVEPRRTVWGMT